VNENQKLERLEQAYAAACLNIANATDGVGLKIMITPSRPCPPGANPMLMGIPRPEDFARKIKSLMLDDTIAGERKLYRGEEALARNIALLAKGWEAATRYWDFKQELDK
jgi:hypothetical protein